MPALGLHVNDKVADLEKLKAAEVEDAAERQVGEKASSCSGDNLSGIPGNSSSKGASESSSMVDSDILWEELLLGEEVGQGNWMTSIFQHNLSFYISSMSFMVV